LAKSDEDERANKDESANEDETANKGSDHVWRFPLRETTRSPKLPSGGTIIEIKDIHQQIKSLLADDGFQTQLIKKIGETYTFFIGTICRISVNGRDVEPLPLTIGSWQGERLQVDRLNDYGCEVRIIAGLSPRSMWAYEFAGWYIFCNGRNVLSAEKSELTGWGNLMPLYMSKFRGFRGLAFFFSSDPEKLPWTTTKTNINRESAVYKLALPAMVASARPVLSFLDSLYQSDEVE
jgi:hypothetical protein